MSKSPYVLPLKYKELAIANNISLQTVYKRIQRGWNFERACTELPRKPPNHVFRTPRLEGMLQTSRPKGKQRGFMYYKDSDDILDKAIEESGLSISDFVAMCIEEYLKREKSNGRKRKK